MKLIEVWEVLMVEPKEIVATSQADIHLDVVGTPERLIDELRHTGILGE